MISSFCFDRSGPSAGKPDAPALPPAQFSRAVEIARVLCLLGIVYVHAWTGLTGADLARVAHTWQGELRWTLIELVGRTAVPLLGMISGWLVAGSVARRGYGVFLTGKARTLLVPMILWNALSILLVSGAAWLGVLRAPVPHSLWWVIDELFCLATPNDINVQTAFLRDLFVCMALAPLLARLRDLPLALVGVAVAVWAVGEWWMPLLLRPQILLFFIAGMMARRHGLAARVGTWRVAAVALPFAVLAPLKIAMSVAGGGFAAAHPCWAASLDIALRFAAALFVWRIALALARRPAGARIARAERYAFMLFCAHLIFLWLGGPLAGMITGPLGAPAYPAFLLLQPFLALGLTIALARLLLLVAPRAAALLSGGRLRVDDAAPPAGKSGSLRASPA